MGINSYNIAENQKSIHAAALENIPSMLDAMKMDLDGFSSLSISTYANSSNFQVSFIRPDGTAEEFFGQVQNKKIFRTSPFAGEGNRIEYEIQTMQNADAQGAQMLNALGENPVPGMAAAFSLQRQNINFQTEADKDNSLTGGVERATRVQQESSQINRSAIDCKGSEYFVHDAQIQQITIAQARNILTPSQEQFSQTLPIPLTTDEKKFNLLTYERSGRPDHNYDEVEAIFHPRVAYAFSYKSKEPLPIPKTLKVVCDHSTTSQEQWGEINSTALQIQQFLQKEIGGKVGGELLNLPQFGYEHVVQMMPDDVSQKNYSLIIENENEFVNYFANKIFRGTGGQLFKINGGEATVQSYVNNFIKNKEAIDPDSHTAAIRDFISSYSQGDARFSDLVLVGDGGNSYRKWVFDKNAYEAWKKDPWHYYGAEPWRYEFDHAAFDADMAAVQQFHKEHPEARIHLSYRPFSPGEKNIFTPSSDHMQIAQMAKATGGKVMDYNEQAGFSISFQKPKPHEVKTYALVQRNEIIDFFAKPHFRNIFSSVIGSNPFVNIKDPLKFRPSSMAAEGSEVDMKGFFIFDPEHHTPAPLKPLGYRIDETTPWYEFGFQYFGMYDLMGKGYAVSSLLDKYMGTIVANNYALKAYNQWKSPQPKGAESYKATNFALEYFEANKNKILSDMWKNTTAEEFNFFGKRGNAIKELSENLALISYFEGWMAAVGNASPEYSKLKAQRDYYGTQSIAYASNIFAPDKTSMGLYYATLLNSMYRIGTAKDAGPAHFQLFWNSGFSEVPPEDAISKGLGYTPTYRVGVVALRDPHVSLTDNQALLLQLQGYTGVFLNSTINGTMFDFLQSSSHNLYFRLDAGIGALFGDGTQALKLGVVDIKGQSYSGRWDFEGGAIPLGFVRAGVEGKWNILENNLSLDYSATILGPPLGLTTFLGYGKDVQGIYDIAPQLNQNIPPTELSINPKWTFLTGPLETIVQGGVRAILTENKKGGPTLVPTSISLGATGIYKGHEFSLTASTQGITGLDTQSLIAKYSTEILPNFELGLSAMILRASKGIQKEYLSGYENNQYMSPPDYIDVHEKNLITLRANFTYTIPDLAR